MQPGALALCESAPRAGERPGARVNDRIVPPGKLLYGLPIIEPSTAKLGNPADKSTNMDLMSIAERLKELGIALPSAPAPAANYVPYVVEGNLIFVAGQGTYGDNGKLNFIGKVGADISIDEGYQAARLCGLNCLAQLNAAAGGLDKIRRIVKVLGFVNCTPEFTDQPKVINGASDLFVEILGDAGRHARSAVGMGSLPFGIATEVELIAAI